MNEIEVYGGAYRAKEFIIDAKRNAINRLVRMKALTKHYFNDEIFNPKLWDITYYFSGTVKDCCDGEYSEKCQRCICGHSIHTYYIVRRGNIKCWIGSECIEKFIEEYVGNEVKKKKQALLEFKEPLKWCKCGSRKKMTDRKCKQCQYCDESTRDYRREMKEIIKRKADETYIDPYPYYHPMLLELRKKCPCGINYTKINGNYCPKCLNTKCLECGKKQLICDDLGCINKCKCGKIIDEKYTQCYNCIKKCNCGNVIYGDYKQCYKCFKIKKNEL